MNRPRIVGCLAMTAVLAAGLLFWTQPGEPVFQGKTLRAWTALHANARPDDREEIEETLRQMATNAAPWLVRELRVRDSPFRKKLLGLVNKQSWIKIRFKTAGIRRAEALGVFRILGPDAKPAVPALIEALQDVRADVRFGAVIALQEIGPEAEAAIPALAAALNDSQDNIRHNAGGALIGIGRPAVPVLTNALKHPEVRVRRIAVRDLADIGPDAALAISELTEALRDADSEVREHAAEALGSIGPEAGPAVPSLIEALNDDVESVRREAAEALGWIGPEAREAIPALSEIAKDSQIGRWAIDTLASMGNQAVPALIQTLMHSDPGIRRQTVEALRQMGSEAKAAIPALLEALKDENRDVQNSAANSFDWLRSEAQTILPTLVSLLRDARASVRTDAALAMGRLGPAGEPGVPALVAALRDGNASIREFAAGALGDIGPGASNAVAALLEARADGTITPGYHVIQALGKIGAHANVVVPVLHTALRNRDPRIRVSAISALANPALQTPDSIPLLIALSQSGSENSSSGSALNPPVPLGEPSSPPDLPLDWKYENARVRQSAVETLGCFSPASEEIVAALSSLLIVALSDRNSGVRMQAARALDRFGPKAKAAFPILIERLSDRNKDVRLYAAHAVAMIHPRGTESLPPLIEALRDGTDFEGSTRRQFAAETLAKLGLAAQTAVPALRLALKDRDHEFRKAAEKALRAIDAGILLGQ